MEFSIFLSPLITVVVKKAADSLIQQFCKTWDMEENHDKLHRQLVAIQDKIADVEDRGLDSPAKQLWMKELRAAALKAVDVLDEFQYEVLRQNAISQQKRPASTKALKNFMTLNDPLFCLRMSNKLKKVLERIDKIVTEMKQFDFVARDPVFAIDRETISFVNESEVIGREGEKEKIVNTLLDKQRERDNISVLPLVGMGGLGKTTLAQLVYNDQRVKQNFQPLMWVCVSKDFNVVNIITRIIEVAPNGGTIFTSNMEALRRRLCEILDNKRYLLVLDDVWNEEIGKLDNLKTMLSCGVSSGSVIIVTTRSKRVASIMGTLPSHDLSSLNEEDSWKLFAKKAFGEGGEELPDKFNKFGKIIVSKCSGVPLALKTMGGMMRFKRNVHEWHDVAENKTWEGEQSTNEILPALKLSYDELPPYSKQCFAFCAIFAQDHEIERETLIQLWMANDFIPTNGTMDLEEKGRYIFEELYWRSFFQDIREKETGYGSIITCKMHDLMHDLATRIAGNRCSSRLHMNYLETQNYSETQNQIEHLSMSGFPFTDLVLQKLPSIRTLLVNGYRPSYNIYEESFHSLKSSYLRALQFISHVRLPKQLGNMKHIRYLDLSEGEFHTLPETISILYNILTLKLSGSKIRELPKEMRNMTTLRHLFLDRCDNLQCMPVGLRQLKCLRTLTKYIANPSRGGSVTELKNLNLWGHLSLSGLESINESDAIGINLAAKTNLYSLNLEWGPTYNERRMENNQIVLEALTPHKELKYLTINGYGGYGFSKWMMKSLIIRNLKRLRLKKCLNCAELPPMWQLPLLDNLYLEDMESLIYIVGGRCVHVEETEPLVIFPNLEVLEMASLPNLESWHEKDSKLVQFPKLNNLVIKECAKLKTVPVHAPLLNDLTVENSSEIKLHQISNLPILSVIRITSLCFLTEPDAFRPPKTLVQMDIEGIENVSPLEEEDDQSFQTTSLCTLTIRRSNCFFSCRSNKLALGFWKYFAALELLEIYNCHALVFWPEDEFRNLNCLKKLVISNCGNFTGSLQVSSSQTPCDEDSLPRLEALDICDCPEVVEVRGCSKSLKELSISRCFELPREGLAKLTNLTELKRLSLKKCDNLRGLPDGMEHLTSLEKLSISDCRGIESFPEGLQQRLSALYSLVIKGCPALERCCQRGGDYWHLVSLIPLTDFSLDSRRWFSNAGPASYR